MEQEIKILYAGHSKEVVEELAHFPGVKVDMETNMLAANLYLARQQKPDVILCEYYLSGGSGVELHDQVRENYQLNDVSFILIHHEFKEEIIKLAFEKRMDDFFVIPLPKASDLVGRIDFLKKYHAKYQRKKPEEKLEDLKYVMPLSKRVFDVVFASLALFCLSPILLIVIIAIRLESKGKVYYTSKRVGREPFDFYKLRSMRTGADAELKKLAKEKNQYATAEGKSHIDFDIPCPRCSKLPEGEYCSPLMHVDQNSICDYWFREQKKEIDKNKAAFVKIANDPRVTKVGKFIRNTSIDELPQLINVIKGDMSIVGNRPLPVYEAELLTKGEMAKRFLAPAGITGLWQVELRGRGGVMSEEERKKLDNEYTDHFAGNGYSFWYDMKLVLRTFKAVFQKDSV